MTDACLMHSWQRRRLKSGRRQKAIGIWDIMGFPFGRSKSLQKRKRKMWPYERLPKLHEQNKLMIRSDRTHLTSQHSVRIRTGLLGADRAAGHWRVTRGSRGGTRCI